MRFLLTFLFAAQVALFGQPTDAPKLEKVLAKHYKAMGGVKKLALIKTSRTTIKASRGKVEFQLITETMEPSSVRIERGLPNGGTHITIINESGGWMFEVPMSDNASTPISQLSEKDIGGIRLVANYGNSPFVGYEGKGFKVKYLGLAKLEKSTAHKVSLKTKEGLEFVYFLDSKTYLPTKMERGNSATIFGNYKKANGIKAAHTLELPSTGLKMVIEKLEINPTIDPERFQVPKAKPESRAFDKN